MGKSLRKATWQWRGLLLIIPAVTASVLGLRLSGRLQPLELMFYDQFMRLRPAETPDPRILIIGITEADLAQKGWPISDCTLARSLTQLKTLQPTAIGLDLYRNLRQNSSLSKYRDPCKGQGYQQLQKLFATTPNLIGIEKVGNDRTSEPIPPPETLANHNQIAANDVLLDPDGRIRRGLLYLYPENRDGIEGLATRLATHYLTSQNLTPDPNAEILTFNTLPPTVFPPLEADDGSYQNIDAQGYQILINYRGKAQNFDRASLTELLNGQLTPDRVQGRIVLIGAVASSLNDSFMTPYDSGFAESAVKTPGVEIHAHLTSQLLSTVLDRRSGIHFWPDWLETLWIIAWISLGAILTWYWRYTKPRQAPVRIFVLVGLGCSLILGSYWAFCLGWWVPVLPSGLGYTIAILVITSYLARRAADIRKTFGRYLTDEVVTQLLETPEGLKLGGERRQITLLMADLRGFSAAAEQQPPENVLAFLNRYLECMTDVITRYQGTIDEFMGDGILVMFGAPTQRPDDADRAIACAIAMQQAIAQVNQFSHLIGLNQVEMGIGITTGEVVVGNIGSAKRAKYGVVGSHINLTARIESQTVGGQILISEATRALVVPQLSLGQQLQIHTKGFSQPVTLHEVLGIGAPYHLQLENTLEPPIALPQPIAVEYMVLDGKAIEETASSAEILALSDHEIDLYSERSLEPLLNLKLNLLTPDRSADFYAKVQGAIGPHTYRLRLTFLPPAVETLLTATPTRQSSAPNPADSQSTAPPPRANRTTAPHSWAHDARPPA
ncbi:adenylate/guanylate cyclase domain-containing protein [Alkalinema sp. FACHB-956]|uniref:CHASE2 domain-containing protein n=1 Tax=Alkalinema sp. FACHB-956 TaxID=2692768 RepID=UPI001689C4FE|nr:adenylate/guanylate cyclase domain-containing protein [Alkalinema sp. FACHB-956]MBD2328103.1 adenylate/guanylate cyclase domain-containing protein [Alkalinema sp. FACHB-956]